MYRRQRNTETITLEYIDAKLDAKFDRFEEKWRQDRKEEAERHAATLEKMEARIAADRKEAEARQQAAETRLANERKEAEARQQTTETRLVEERKEARREYNTQRFWMIANFIVLLLGVGGIIATVLIDALNGRTL